MYGSARIADIPNYLSFLPVDDIATKSDLDSRAKGLTIYEKIAIIEGDDSGDKYIERAYYYDYKGRVIQTVEKNHLSRIGRYSTKYDFVGNVLKTEEAFERNAMAWSCENCNTIHHQSSMPENVPGVIRPKLCSS